MSDTSEPLYPVDPWSVRQETLAHENVGADETIFALGNGLLGIRGTYCENGVGYTDGTFVNGFYETEPIVYGERAYGYAEFHQRMIPLPDATIIELTINEEPFDLTTGELVSHTRELNLREGKLTRNTEWLSPIGTRVSLQTTRLVSFRRPHICAIKWSVRCDTAAHLQIHSVVRGRNLNRPDSSDPRVGGGSVRSPLLLGKRRVDERVASIRYRTRNSGADVITAIANVVETETKFERSHVSSQHEVGHTIDVDLAADEQLTVHKYISVFTSLGNPRGRISGLARREVEMARRSGFPALAKEQRSYLDGFWDRSDLTIDGDAALQQSIRFTVFHLLQAAGRDGHTSVPAKGLTGAGYEGHYFWDTEAYMMPFYVYTNPGVARALLEYRYSTLDAARERAQLLHHRGALYPWRTINGEEASAYFPAGTAQYHINADIVYALRTYVRATGDRWFLLKRGAEMLFETARFWADLGCFIEGKGFCINGVTGPDEYTAIVNNNVYTNLMAADALGWAASVYAEMREHDTSTLSALTERIGLDTSEPELWKRAADAVYVPYDEQRGVHPQDDAFFGREVWDFENTPPERYPLLLHYHPLTIYRHQVLKQPDLVMALFTQGTRFTAEQKRRDFEYYDPLTTGDSSLAPCIQSIVAAEIGETELAYRYFMKTARMDLDNVNGNVHHGVHAAAMAGTWLSMVYGFAGMRDYDGILDFQPNMPDHWNGFSFRVLWKGTALHLAVGRQETIYSLPGGGTVSFSHCGQPQQLSGTQTVTLPNAADKDIRSGQTGSKRR